MHELTRGLLVNGVDLNIPAGATIRLTLGWISTVDAGHLATRAAHVTKDADRLWVAACGPGYQAFLDQLNRHLDDPQVTE
ncbi:MAG TPA: hypothetical protein VGD67_22845 [Pseudonocardiaceae bacterium]